MDFLFVVVLFFCFFERIKSYNCCKYPTLEGIIDLTPLSGHYWSIKPFTADLSHHVATFTLCQDLDVPHQCQQQTSTVGPTNMKDEYKEGKHCYYIGGIGNCTLDGWSHEGQEFRIFFPGVWSKESPRELRSLELFVKCDRSENPGKMKPLCTYTQPHDQDTIYTCHLNTIYGCPGYVPPAKGNWFFDIFLGVGGILLIIIVVLGVIYLIVGVIVFIIRKVLDKTTPWKELLLGFFIWKFGFQLVIDGCVFIFELIFALFGVGRLAKGMGGDKREYQSIESGGGEGEKREYQSIT